MNAFTLYVAFTPSTATVIVQLETPTLLYLCRKALTPLLQLTALPTATEHGSHKGLAEQLGCCWRTSFILEDLGIYEQQYQINGRSTPREDWKMKAEVRQRNRTKLFLSSAFTPSSHSISTIFTTSDVPLPYPPLTFFIPPSVYPHLRERKFKLHLLWTQQGEPKEKKKKKEDWGESFATMWSESWKID